MSGVGFVVVFFGHDGQRFFGNRFAAAGRCQLPRPQFIFNGQPYRIAQKKSVVVTGDTDLADEGRRDLAAAVFKRRMVDLKAKLFALAAGDVQDVAELDADAGGDLDRPGQKPRQLGAVLVERFINPKALHHAF